MPTQQITDQLIALREEFPGWWFGCSERLVPWDAKRRRDGGWTGGVLVIEAASAEMLRELLLEVQILDAKYAGARYATVEQQGDARLYALSERLRVHGLEARRGDGTLTVLTPDTGEPADTITCKPRVTDADRMWFFSGSGEPIAEASHIIDAALIIASTVTVDVPADVEEPAVYVAEQITRQDETTTTGEHR